MVLPVVLFLVIALTLVSTSILLVAGTEGVLERHGLAYLRASAAEEMVLHGRAGETDGELVRDEHPLGGGFVLVEARTAGAAVSSFAVVRYMRPEQVLAALPGGVEVSGTAPGLGIEWLPGCPSRGERPLVRTRSSGSGPDVDGVRLTPAPLPDPSALLELARTELAATGGLPVAEAPDSFRAPDGAVLSGGEAAGLLVAAGNLSVRADTRFRGLVVVPGRLELAGSARIEGVVLAGSIEVSSSSAGILGCPGSTAPALGLTELRGPHPVERGGYLGRF